MKILLAESDSQIRSTLLQSLESSGVNVQVVTNGAAALIAMLKPDAASLAILPAVFPGISGPDVCKQLRARLGAKCPPLVLTGPSPIPENPADYFFQKPFDAESFAESIKDILQKGKSDSQTNDIPVTPQNEAPKADPTVQVSEPVYKTPLDEKMGSVRGCTGNSSMLIKALSGLGLDSIEMEESEFPTKKATDDISVWSVLVLPTKGLWFDLLLEADRPSIKNLLELALGQSEATEDDMEDILREALNLLQGTFKTAFNKEKLDALSPVIPKQIPAEKLSGWSRSRELHNTLHYTFSTEGMKLKLTLFPTLSTPDRYPTDLLAVANVLTQPVHLPGQIETVLFNKGTMLTLRYLEKLQNLDELEDIPGTYEAVRPSPLTESFI